MRGLASLLLAGAVLASVLVSALLTSAPARADWEPEGAIRAGAIVEGGDPVEIGGHLAVELWHGFGAFTFGGLAGVGVLSTEAADRSQVFTPLALSLGVRLGPDPVGLHVLVRGGGWGGATNRGLQGGALLGGAAYLEIALERTLAIGIGVEVWQLFGNDDKLLFLPQLSLVWWGGPGEAEGPYGLDPEPFED